MKEEKRSPLMMAIPEAMEKRSGKKTPSIASAIPEATEKRSGKKALSIASAVPEGQGEKAEVRITAPVSSIPPAINNKPEEETIIPEVATPSAEDIGVSHIGVFKGLNKRQVYDSNSLSSAVNVGFKNMPYVESEKVAELVQTCTFKVKVEKTETNEAGEDVEVTRYEEQAVSEVYDAVTRGDELFIACDKGYVYGKMVDGKLKYIAIAHDNERYNRPDAETRLCFCETHDTIDDVLTVKKHMVVYSTYDVAEYDDKLRLPVFQCGSIEFIDSFVDLYNTDEEKDVTRIYCVCDKKGKVVEVWKHFASVPKHCEGGKLNDVWAELRRNIYVRPYDGGITCGYIPKQKSGCISEVGAYASGMVGIPIKNEGEFSDASDVIWQKKLTTMGNIDTRLKTYHSIEADDNIGGLRHIGNPNCYHYSPGIFDYEITVAPKFNMVTFFKGRIFGTVDSRIITSKDNSYNEWTLDTSDNISSANAWMSLTSANANADGDVVAMHEYLGRLSILKRNYLQEIYGGSNPFTVQDVYAVGTPFSDGVCEAYGRLCFCGKHAIRTYGGSFPRVIGDEIGVDEYRDVHMIGEDRRLLVKTGDEVFSYDFVSGLWTEKQSEFFNNTFKFVVLSGNIYAITHKGELVAVEGSRYGDWEFATAAVTANTLDLKRLQRVRLTYELGPGASFEMHVDKSDADNIKTITRENGTDKTVVKRCEVSLTNAVDWFVKLRFKGKGYFKLLSLDMGLKGGAEVKYE